MNHMKIDYAILAAMEDELAFVLTTFSSLPFVTIYIGDLNFRIYDYHNQKVLVAATGIGTSFAACVLTFINSHFDPDYFLICGTAGGIHPELKLRDVVIAEKAFEAEIQDVFSLVKNTPFESCLNHPIKNQHFPAQYSASSELLKASPLSLENCRIFKGTVVSSNAFPAPLELFNKIKKLNPYSIDMETSAFYQAAWLLNKKIIAIRGISNILNVDGTDENIHESDVKGSSEAAARVLLEILNKQINYQ